MENTQSAVEFAEDELSKLFVAAANMEITHPEYHKKRVWIWHQAKVIEKEQIIEFANKVLYNAECSFTGNAYLEKDINEFYKETYGQI